MTSNESTRDLIRQSLENEIIRTQQRLADLKGAYRKEFPGEDIPQGHEPTLQQVHDAGKKYHASNSQKAASTAPVKKSGGKKLKWRECVELVLKEAEKPLSTQDVADRAAALYAGSPKNPRATVSSLLSKMQKDGEVESKKAEGNMYVWELAASREVMSDLRKTNEELQKKVNEQTTYIKSLEVKIGSYQTEISKLRARLDRIDGGAGQ